MVSILLNFQDFKVFIILIMKKKGFHFISLNNYMINEKIYQICFYEFLKSRNHLLLYYIGYFHIQNLLFVFIFYNIIILSSSINFYGHISFLILFFLFLFIFSSNFFAYLFYNLNRKIIGFM